MDLTASLASVPRTGITAAGGTSGTRSSGLLVMLTDAHALTFIAGVAPALVSLISKTGALVSF